MTQEEKDKIIEYCNKKLQTHTDWTGTRVETKYQCESVSLFIAALLNYIQEL